MRDDIDPFTEKPSSSGELLNELGSIKELLDEELQQRRAAPATAIEEIGSVEEYLRLKQAAEEAGQGIEAYLASQNETAESNAELELLEDEEDAFPVLDEIVTLDDDEQGESELGGDSLLMELAVEEEQPPSTAEATTVEEYFAAVVAAKHKEHRPSTRSLPKAPEEENIPLLDEVVEPDENIPLLDVVTTNEEAIPVLADIATDSSAAAEESGMSLDEMQELVDLIVNRKLQHLKPELEKEVMNELQKLLPLSALTKS